MDIKTQFNVKMQGIGNNVIIFAHGFGCDQTMWRFLLPQFEENFRVVGFDYMGMGQSDASLYDSESHETLNGYAEDLIKICKSLEARNIIFVGHSVSAMIGVLASIIAPGLFSKLILIGPSPAYLNDGDYQGGFEGPQIDALLKNIDNDYIGWSRAMAPAIMGRPDVPEFGEELTNSFCMTNPKIAKEFAKATFMSDNRKDLAHVKVPTLILQCSEDIIAPENVGRFVHDHIPGSKIVFLNAIGHCPHVSSPDETAEAIKNFIY
jgi:sigma-B regulation protein RsbQ